MFRVTTICEAGEGVTLKLEGRLAGPWADELARAVSAAMREDARVTLDLDGLSFADARGLAMIHRAIDGGARLAGGSQFIGVLLQERSR